MLYASTFVTMDMIDTGSLPPSACFDTPPNAETFGLAPIMRCRRWSGICPGPVTVAEHCAAHFQARHGRRLLPAGLVALTIATTPEHIAEGASADRGARAELRGYTGGASKQWTLGREVGR